MSKQFGSQITLRLDGTTVRQLDKRVKKVQQRGLRLSRSDLMRIYIMAGLESKFEDLLRRVE